MTEKKFSERTQDERRTARINMKVLPSIKEMAEAKSASEGRTLSNYIERLIIKDNRQE